MVHDEGNRLVGVLRARTVEELRVRKHSMAGFSLFFG